MRITFVGSREVKAFSGAGCSNDEQGLQIAISTFDISISRSRSALMCIS